MSVRAAVEVLCWLPDKRHQNLPRAIPVGHTGLRAKRTVYSFWPDHDGVERGHATPAPGSQAERDRESHLKKMLAHPAFLGGWIGLVHKETSSFNAGRFLAMMTDALVDPAASEYRFEGGVLVGPNVPRLAAYGLSLDPDCVERLKSACDDAHRNPPEYSFHRHCFCTPLVAHMLNDAGAQSFDDAPVKRPEDFRKWLDQLVLAQDSPVAYRHLRTIGYCHGSGRVLDWVSIEREGVLK